MGRTPWSAADALVGLLLKSIKPRRAGPGGSARTRGSAPLPIYCRAFSIAVAAEGGKADIATPMHGLGSGVWVVHAFQKKSTQGIKTPRREINLIRDRLKRLKEMLQ